MPIAYLDCFAGISGDMFLGALLGAGVPLEVLEGAVRALGLDASLKVEIVDRSGISSTKVHVLEGGEFAETAPGHTHEHSHEGDHSHSHEHSHEHEHSHGHGDEHLHADVHVHADEAAHSHTHEHAHSHEHEHGDHVHSHEHDSPHEHERTPAPEPHNHPHVHGRSLTVIRELIQASALSEPVKHFAIRTFELLGRSEAKIHNVPIDRIHFHEVGAVDAIVDIVAASAGIDYLNRAGKVGWFCSSINVGSGMVECAHGTFPVPAPATADLLRGMPTYSAHVQKELVTPTGAALLHALAPTFGTQPSMRVQSIGYGAGLRNPKAFPNVLRLSIGESASTQADPTATVHAHGSETVTVLETALDDASPQILADVAERALEAGALDVMLSPVIMKKGRPGTLITVLCNPASSAFLEQLLLRETTTLGIRIHREERSCLDRRHETVATPYGELRVKIGSLRGEEWNVMPEYEDCRAAAALYGVPVKQVMQAAVASYATLNAR